MTGTAPRWAIRAAHLIALITLPSRLWRLAVACGFSLGVLEQGAPMHVHGSDAIVLAGLTVVSEIAALATFALVKPSRLPPRLVVTLAASGAVALQVIWAYTFARFPAMELEFTHDGWYALLLACYLPLLLWAPLLAAITYDYYRRNIRTR